MTRNGIEYNLSKSPYRFETPDFIFVFSSEMHMKKFENQRHDRKNYINESLSNRFNIFIDSETLSDLILYRRIENRGELVLNKRGEKICLNKVKLGIKNQI